ncbi:MAG: helix-turn-helix transcriptional regulator [Oscillospiraceae bacterium]|nr:helix-turn-helix transcriptional regulator [Oscillospiraceae bacterium]
MNKKPTTWEDIRSSITVLTQEEWDEIDLKVKIVGEILKARQDENLTQRALEELSGIKQPVIARIENGKTDPQLGTVLKILRPLGKTLAVVDMNRESRV